MKKVPFPVDKRQWSPSLIPGPVVLVSSHDSEGRPNIAPKSWLQMVSFEPPILVFSGRAKSTTGRNILATKCFTVNFVDSSRAEEVYGCIQWFGQERIEKLGLTLSPATKVTAPLIDQCRAHLECSLVKAEEIGSGLVIYGEILAASIWEEIARAEGDGKYALLDPLLYLESRFYSGLGEIRRIDGGHQHFVKYVILLAAVKGKTLTRELHQAHADFLRRLDAEGRLVLAGPFADHNAGMIIIKAASREEAHRLAEEDPFIIHGYRRYELRTLECCSRHNDYCRPK